MATIVITIGAREDLRQLIESRDLPDDTGHRLRSQLKTLETYPNSGRPLLGKWHGHRLLVGPWHWMLVVYWYDEQKDVVVIASFEDSRQQGAATRIG